MSVGDFMHGLDALLMMLIQRFPAQGNQTGFHAAPMNDDCRTRMVAQQAHFLVGRDEDSVQAEFPQRRDDPTGNCMGTARERLVEHDGAEQRPAAAVGTERIAEGSGQHIGGDDLLLATTTALRTCSGFDDIPAFPIDHRYRELQAEARIQKCLGSLIPAVFAGVLEQPNERLQCLVMALAFIIDETRRVQLALGLLQGAQAFVDDLFRNQTQIASGLKVDTLHRTVQVIQTLLDHRDFMVDIAEQLGDAVIRGTIEVFQEALEFLGQLPGHR